MAHYTNITADEMEQFLAEKGFTKISLPGTVELVYGKRVKQDDLQLSLRCYTGISGAQSRDVGKDAIRVCLFWRHPKTGQVAKISGSKRVHRVEGWRKNLEERLNAWETLLPKHSCEKCGFPMVPRKGSNGAFFGCAGYPMCRHTMKVPLENEE